VEAEVVLRAEVEVVGRQGLEGGEGRPGGLLLEAFEEHQGLRMVVKIKYKCIIASRQIR
jgi:hypothetical protein